jgi:hypothetical protein
LRRGRLRLERAERKQNAHRLEQLHFWPERRIGSRSETTRRIKSSAFFPAGRIARCVENTSRGHRHGAQTAAGAPCEAAPCPFSAQLAAKTDAKNPQVNR